MSTYEAPDLAAAIKRMTRALVKRAADGEIEAISALFEIEQYVHNAVDDAIAAAHTGPHEFSFHQLGQELGISRQAAHHRAQQSISRSDVA